MTLTFVSSTLSESSAAELDVSVTSASIATSSWTSDVSATGVAATSSVPGLSAYTLVVAKKPNISTKNKFLFNITKSP